MQSQNGHHLEETFLYAPPMNPDGSLIKFIPIQEMFMSQPKTQPKTQQELKKPAKKPEPISAWVTNSRRSRQNKKKGNELKHFLH